jgi:hypothetical protein
MEEYLIAYLDGAGLGDELGGLGARTGMCRFAIDSPLEQRRFELSVPP